MTHNLIAAEGDVRPVQAAEITPPPFKSRRTARCSWGACLMEAAERPAAPSVAVIAYDVWRTRFGSDPAVLGRSVQLGTEHVTVVGVMRKAFAFPVADDVWTPLRTGALITLAGSIEIWMPGLTGELSFGQVASSGQVRPANGQRR